MELLRSVLPLVMIVSCFSMLPSDWEAMAEGSGPVFLEGQYLVKTPEGIYEDHVQPGDSPSYTLVIENDMSYETAFRATISRVPSGWLGFFDNGQGTVLVNIPAAGEVRQNLIIKAPTEGVGKMVINVSVEGGSAWWLSNLYVTAAEGPMILQVPGSSFILGREDPVNVPFTVKNIGSTPINASFSMSSMVTSETPIKDKWNVQFSVRDIALSAGETKTITATVRCPKDEPINSQKLSTISVKAEGIERPFQSKTLTFKVETIYDLRTTVAPSGYERVAMGASKEYTVLIENWASATDHVIIEPEDIPGGWTISFNDIIDPFEIRFTVTPGEKRALHPVVYIAPNAEAGKQSVVLRALGDKNTTIFSLKVEVEREEGLTVRSLSTSGIYALTLGETIFSIGVANTGNYYEDVDISIQSAPSWLDARFIGIKVGGEFPLDLPQPVVNISELTRNLVSFPSSDRMTVHYKAFQSAEVRMSVKVPMDVGAQPEAKIGLKFVYGGTETVKEVFISVKLILVDLEIIDSDSDGLPNLNIWPARSRSHYMVGDRIYLIFNIKNEYPFPTEGVGFSIDLFGYEVAKGDLGVIEPGQVRSYNISWKINKPTEGSYPFRLKLTGEKYPVGVESPSAKTKEEVSIGGGKVAKPIGTIIAFVLIMVLLIVVFLALVHFAKKNKADREIKELAEYERIYGKRTSGLRSGPREDVRRGRIMPPPSDLKRTALPRDRLGLARSRGPEPVKGTAPVDRRPGRGPSRPRTRSSGMGSERPANKGHTGPREGPTGQKRTVPRTGRTAPGQHPVHRSGSRSGRKEDLKEFEEL
jgi:uncharacterized membrane protein